MVCEIYELYLAVVVVLKVGNQKGERNKGTGSSGRQEVDRKMDSFLFEALEPIRNSFVLLN